MRNMNYEKLPQNFDEEDEVQDEIDQPSFDENQKCYEIYDVNENDELLQYDTRVNKKTDKSDVRKYKIIRYFFIVLILTTIFVLLSITVYMCATFQCVNKNLKNICDKGYCYDVNIEEFQDSNHDKIGDFVGLKNHLKNLKENEIETLLIDFRSINTQQFHDFISFADMASKARTLGISVLVKLAGGLTSNDTKIIQYVRSQVQGFVIDDPKLYEPNKDFFRNIPCYVRRVTENDESKQSFCKGSIFVMDGTYVGGIEDLLKIVAKEQTTPSWNSVLGFKNFESKLSQNKETDFLISLSILSMSNGSIFIKAGHELVHPLMANYSLSHNSTDKLQKNIFSTMKRLVELRRYYPYLGRNASIVVEKLKTMEHCYAITKSITSEKSNFTIMYILNLKNKSQKLSLGHNLNIAPKDAVKIELSIAKDPVILQEKVGLLEVPLFSVTILSVIRK